MRKVGDVKMWLTDKCVSNDADAFIMIGWLKAKYGEGRYGFKMIWAINVIRNRAAVGADQYKHITLEELSEFVASEPAAETTQRPNMIRLGDMHKDIEKLKRDVGLLKSSHLDAAIKQYLAKHGMSFEV